MHCSTRCSWTTPNYLDSFTTLSSSSSSTLNSSFRYSLRTALTKGHRFVACSLHHHSSSSSSSSTASSSSPPLIPNVTPGSKLRTTTTVNKDESQSIQNPTRDNKGTRSFKSLFGKRHLWRRNLFASKKVRSIILLNIISLVYGNLTLLSFLLNIVTYFAISFYYPKYSCSI